MNDYQYIDGKISGEFTNFEGIKTNAPSRTIGSVEAYETSPFGGVTVPNPSRITSADNQANPAFLRGFNPLSGDENLNFNFLAENAG